MVLSVVQPLVYLLTLGFGFNALFQQAGKGSYIQFVVPGVVAQTILFTSIFWGINIMWDKQFGFLKETLVAPVSRLKVMLGGSLGGATIAVIQGLVLFIIALIFGFHPYSWSMLGITLIVMAMLAVTMVSFSSGIGAIVNDMQGFMAITNFLVIPLFFLSSALFPLDIEANSESIPLNDNFFDVIICSNSFHHYLHPDKAMKEIRRLLKPGGKIFILDPTADTLFIKFIDKIIKLVESAHVKMYSTKEFKQLMTTAELQYLESRTIKGEKVHIGEK